MTPDIAFPIAVNDESFGEAAFDNALPWVRIDAASYAPLSNSQDKLGVLRSRHEGRISQDKDFLALQEDIAEVTRLRQENAISLNEDERRKLRDDQEARAARREVRSAAGKPNSKLKLPNLRDDGLQSEERSLKSELAEAAERKNAPDPVLNEAARILGDAVGLQKPATRLTAKVVVKAAQER